MPSIHPSSIIHPSAEIADTVEIGPYCIVGEHVSIGPGSRLLHHVVISGPTTIGRDNHVYPFTVIGADPQDLKFAGEPALCLIGDRNHIREHVTIHRGTTNGGNLTSIGSDNLLMVACHVAHDCRVGSHCVIANQVMLGGHAVIEDFVNIGGGVGIHHYTTVGTLAFIGGLTRVKKDVPPYMTVEGDPAEVRGVNSIGLTRRHYGDHVIGALKTAYKRLYRSNGNAGEHVRSMSEVIDQLLSEFRDIQPVVHLCESLRRSAVGVHGRSRELLRSDSKFATQPK